MQKNANNKPLAIFLFGATATGKTDLAIKLYQSLPCEIISVDSALIYKDMNIGTAKPTDEEQHLAPHHLIDILDPSESYSVSDFYHDALSLMNDITARGKIPVLVGGTMLYFKALLDGLSPLPHSTPEVREKINTIIKERGSQGLYQKLKEVDPQSASQIKENDSQRLGRALEVYYLSGQKMSDLLQIKGQGIDYNILQFSIEVDDRSVLHKKIEDRFTQMIELGFVDEVKQLFNRGDLDENMPSIRCVGYRQIWYYLQGKISLDDAIFQGVCATRQLAKRQITWQRGWNSETIPLKFNKNKENFEKMITIIKREFAL